jgi:hypothetical protein
MIHRRSGITVNPPRDEMRPVERALMLMALGLDPRRTFTDFELQCAWRRRKDQVQPDTGGTTMIDAALNAAYVTLIGRAGVPRPLNVRL